MALIKNTCFCLRKNDSRPQQRQKAQRYSLTPRSTRTKLLGRVNFYPNKNKNRKNENKTKATEGNVRLTIPFHRDFASLNTVNRGR